MRILRIIALIAVFMFTFEVGSHFNPLVGLVGAIALTRYAAIRLWPRTPIFPTNIPFIR